METNNEIPREDWPQAIEIAKKCGCMCHSYMALHCFPCCNATYFRVDLAEKAVVEEHPNEVV